MIGTTGEGWLSTLSHGPKSAWGDVELFYAGMETNENERENEDELIIVESKVWGKFKDSTILPKPGDGFAFYHSTRARFPQGDKFKRKPRISAMGELLDYAHEGREVTWIKVAINSDVFQFLKENPIVRNDSTQALFEQCVQSGPPASYYKVDAHTWNGFVSLLPTQTSREEGDGEPRQKQFVGEGSIVDFPDDDNEPPGTVAYTINRRVRKTAKGEQLKMVYDCRCQVCGYRISVPRAGSDWYVEVHHLKPLGGAHRGRDKWDNMLVLCPNCHAEFDVLAMAIDPKTQRVTCYDDRDTKAGNVVKFRGGHFLATENIKYHWERFREAKSRR